MKVWRRWKVDRNWVFLFSLWRVKLHNGLQGTTGRQNKAVLSPLDNFICVYTPLSKALKRFECWLWIQFVELNSYVVVLLKRFQVEKTMFCVSVSNGNQWSTDTFVMNVECLPKSSNGVIVLKICTLSCDAKSDWMSNVWSIKTIEGSSLLFLRPQKTKPFYHLWMTCFTSKRCCQKLGNTTTADCGSNLTKPTQYLTLHSFCRFLCFLLKLPTTICDEVQTHL